MRSKSYLFLLLVLGLGIVSAILYAKTKYNYGLDVTGGIRLTYQMQLKEADRPRADEIRNQLINILGGRSRGPMGVAEPLIVGKGADQIVVELPGATDVQAAEAIIGTSAKIQFFDAQNVVTEKFPYRPYREVDSGDRAKVQVDFVQTANPAAPTITYPSPQYQQVIDGWSLILEGNDLQSAEAQPAGQGYQPLMHFSPAGSAKLETWSRQHYNQREKLAAVLDGKVLSIAPVNENTILKDAVVIEGQFSNEYVKSLVDLLNGGALPVNLKELSAEKVDAAIGKFALEKMVTAGAIAFGVIAVFLLAYYAFPGFVALIALSLYVLFTLAALKLMNATFSLAAIAGFVLSVGMAVDANILVFERFKEEHKAGKQLLTALQLGFRRALPAIIDSNACTILTSFVLLSLGTGPVKGFATTLIMGVVISLFTAVFVTRSLLLFFAGSGIATNPKWYSVNRNWFGEKFEEAAHSKPFRVVEKSKLWFGISIFTMLVSIPFFVAGGMKLNVEFRGGFEAVYPVADRNLSSADITARLEKAGLKGGNVKLGEDPSGQRRVYITLPSLPQLTSVKDPTQVIAQAANIPVTDPTKISFTKIGPAVQQETIQNAIVAVIVSSCLIVLYLAFRFGIGFGGFAAGLRFGISAVIALLHDVIVVIGTAAIVGFIAQWEISALFLTALLTVIGFSVHDTIVIFDRIRENLHRQEGDDFATVVDKSITQSFARSINTSATVAVTLLVLFFLGTTTPDLKFFVLAMLIGIISGTYSSIYNASPILYLWDKAIARKKGEQASLVGMAHAELRRSRVIQTAAEAPSVTSQTTGRSYGQVRRRANSPQNRGIEIEDED